MHALEHILFVTSLAVENGKITQSELADLLMGLASASHNYGVPNDGEDRLLMEMSEKLGRRFGKLKHTWESQS
jgi:hypothetical protein